MIYINNVRINSQRIDCRVKLSFTIKQEGDILYLKTKDPYSLRLLDRVLIME